MGELAQKATERALYLRAGRVSGLYNKNVPRPSYGQLTAARPMSEIIFYEKKAAYPVGYAAFIKFCQ